MAKTIPAEKFVEGVESIYTEQPDYMKGHDGSDGLCDCIGMCRGALIREGVDDVRNMSGTNKAARFAIENLQAVDIRRLRVGEVVLKTRDPDDPDMPLPDRYRKGGSDYTGDLNNYTHIGAVTKINPLEITHMTSPKPKKDYKIGNWKFSGQLPWVEYSEEGKPDDMWRSTIRRGSRGQDVVYCQDILQALGYDIGKSGADGIFGAKTEEAVKAFQRDRGLQADGIVGPMTYDALEKAAEDENPPLYTVTITGLAEEQADEIIRQYGGEKRREN